MKTNKKVIPAGTTIHITPRCGDSRQNSKHNNQVARIRGPFFIASEPRYLALVGIVSGQSFGHYSDISRTVFV